MKNKIYPVICIITALVSTNVIGGSRSEHRSEFDQNLTWFGAELSGSDTGEIPPYEGGLTTAPDPYVGGINILTNPFPNEEPVLIINQKNMGKYEGRLTEGTKALLRKYPSYELQVYPTHRTAAYPEHVKDNTKECFSNAKLEKAGQKLSGCHAGIPFPVPENGNEAMWNHQTRFTSPAMEIKYSGYYVDESGNIVHGASSHVFNDYPFWDQSKTDPEHYHRFQTHYLAPARRVGEAIMAHDPLDYSKGGRDAWVYLPGQRRVRVAPSIGYDTPNPSTAGASVYDEVYLFNGPKDRFDFKLLGKKEIYVPYNAYDVVYHSNPEELLKPNHMNTDIVRWELHRVWLVEAQLKDGERHIYSKRVFYLDEDSWAVLASDQYDKRGDIFRVGFSYMAPDYNYPAPLVETHGHYDLVNGIYSINVWPAPYGGITLNEPLGEAEWTPNSLAGSGIR